MITAQMMADDIREAGGIMQVNHPNWMWGLSVDDIRPVKGAALLEVYNMGSGCNNEGDPANGRPPVEAIWDDLLTGGKVIWGVCSDDAHRYTEGHPDGPGKGWIVVKADRLTREDVMNSIEKGDFYASTGVELSDVLSTQEGISLTISPDSRSGFVTRFIGSGGKFRGNSQIRHGNQAIAGEQQRQVGPGTQQRANANQQQRTQQRSLDAKTPRQCRSRRSKYAQTNNGQGGQQAGTCGAQTHVPHDVGQHHRQAAKHWPQVEGNQKQTHS